MSCRPQRGNLLCQDDPDLNSQRLVLGQWFGWQLPSGASRSSKKSKRGCMSTPDSSSSYESRSQERRRARRATALETPIVRALEPVDEETRQSVLNDLNIIFSKSKVPGLGGGKDSSFHAVIEAIPLSQIATNPDHPRTGWDDPNDPENEELDRFIRERLGADGIIHIPPLDLTPLESNDPRVDRYRKVYQCFDGMRRYASCIRVSAGQGFPKIPALVHTHGDQTPLTLFEQIGYWLATQRSLPATEEDKFVAFATMQDELVSVAAAEGRDVEYLTSGQGAALLHISRTQAYWYGQMMQGPAEVARAFRRRVFQHVVVRRLHDYIADSNRRIEILMEALDRYAGEKLITFQMIQKLFPTELTPKPSIPSSRQLPAGLRGLHLTDLLNKRPDTHPAMQVLALSLDMVDLYQKAVELETTGFPSQVISALQQLSEPDFMRTAQQILEQIDSVDASASTSGLLNEAGPILDDDDVSDIDAEDMDVEGLDEQMRV